MAHPEYGHLHQCCGCQFQLEHLLERPMNACAALKWAGDAIVEPQFTEGKCINWRPKENPNAGRRQSEPLGGAE
jgi:hypothetical protein